jgi:hypothetical protein
MANRFAVPQERLDMPNRPYGYDVSWQSIAADILKTQRVPQAWITLNNLAERHLRARVREAASFLRSRDFGASVNIDGVLSQRQVESVQHSIYSWFLGCSFILTWGMDDNYHFAGRYETQLCSLNVEKYLCLFGNFYCMRIVAQQGSNSHLARLFVQSAVAVLSNSELASWAEYCIAGDDAPRFIAETSLRGYRALAEAIGLPTDEKALQAARDGRSGFNFVYKLDGIPVRLLTGKYLTLLDDLQVLSILDNPSFMASVRRWLELDQ